MPGPESPPYTLRRPADVHPSMPMGKYYPSNYKNKSKSRDFDWQESDIKRKVQQYRADLVEPAVIAGPMSFCGYKPQSLRLLPLESPGLVMPMDLDECGDSDSGEWLFE
ncbi:hypothetical protein B0O99DRAFT_694921 [Bisporella sp. PMI_857]|nr:hypothetical protein B0O99DRAFT_694921 [Bisporella sp. PMI_857]